MNKNHKIMAHQCDLQININGQHTFFLNQEIMSKYSGKLKKMIKQERKVTKMKNLAFNIEEFPGGSNGFELVSQFCYNFGTISITIHNVSQLYCASIFLGMTEKISNSNLVQQIERFLDGIFDWTWNDVLICLRNCDPFFSSVDSLGLIDKLITALLAKIAQNSDISVILSSNSSSSSSPETPMVDSTRFSGSYSSSAKAWWFDDLSTLSPSVIERVIRTLGAYGSDNNSLLLTRFLIHYLKTRLQTRKTYLKPEYIGLVDTAVYGVILMGKTAFSCRALFSVLRLVSAFCVSKVCQTGLERLIGSMLDSAKLDDILVSAQQQQTDEENGVYDVNLVVRLIRVFVQCENVSLERLQKVGVLVDQYLAEISPDHNLKMSKFIGVAQSLPDLARDCFDGVYRAIDIYLESHPRLTYEERSRLCRCLNYEKLTLQTCKELAKNPRIPPRVAVQALASQKQVKYDPPPHTDQLDYFYHTSPTKTATSTTTTDSQLIVEDINDNDNEDDCSEDGSRDVKLNIQRMQWRVLELEKLCKEMKGQMSKLVKNNNSNNSKNVNSPTGYRSHRFC
ncbi:hypothetical protein RND81_09G193100 [Saponaria officinalis]|uniref:NPH3 domain-containing protein n=1 Tax=Saponaria officinalis TaxID=3572 RepID=A0AAW1IMY3_SAPOF